MADRYLIRHSDTQLHLGEGNTWWACHGEALALTMGEASGWISLACEPQSLEIVPLDLAGTGCCAA